MTLKNRKELFVMLLSNVRQGVERTTKAFQEMSQAVQDQNIKEALEARVFVSDKTLSTLDQCFKLMGEQPMKPTSRLHEVFAEDFRRELSEIQSPELKSLYVLSKASQLIHLRVGEYVALIASAEASGNYGVGVLLESCLADKLAFADRTRRLIWNLTEKKAEAKQAA